MKLDRSVNILGEFAIPGVTQCSIGSMVAITTVTGTVFCGRLHSLGPHCNSIELEDSYTSNYDQDRTPLYTVYDGVLWFCSSGIAYIERIL